MPLAIWPLTWTLLLANLAGEMILSNVKAVVPLPRRYLSPIITFVAIYLVITSVQLYACLSYYLY